jgi:hypothetical protein
LRHFFTPLLFFASSGRLTWVTLVRLESWSGTTDTRVSSSVARSLSPGPPDNIYFMYRRRILYVLYMAMLISKLFWREGLYVREGDRYVKLLSVPLGDGGGAGREHESNVTLRTCLPPPPPPTIPHRCDGEFCMMSQRCQMAVVTATLQKCGSFKSLLSVTKWHSLRS